MKFVHIADMHFDVPFSSLNSSGNLGDKRRLEQRNALRKVIEYVKQNAIEYLFIAGDLYEHDYVRKSTIDHITTLFKEIPKTKIFISPGNHYPYVKGSYYDTHDFGDNVYIFHSSKLEKYEDENVNIYGMAFTDYYMNESCFDNVTIPISNKPNILLAHCDLNGAKDEDGFSYNPVLESKLNLLGFDYGAIGHIHKNNLQSNNRIYYPGSMISLGFDEPGEHGMIVGELTKEKLSMDFVRLDDRMFKEIELDVDKLSSKEDLLEKILHLDLNKIDIYKIILVGKRSFDINPRELLKILPNDNILKIKDETSLSYDIEEIAAQNNLRGIFIRELLNKYHSGECTDEEFQKAIEIGLDAM